MTEILISSRSWCARLSSNNHEDMPVTLSPAVMALVSFACARALASEAQSVFTFTLTSSLMLDLIHWTSASILEQKHVMLSY